MNKPTTLFLFLGAGVTVHGAISIEGFNTLTNDRFANDGSFVADQFDLSGVGLNGPWATMISEKVYITSQHFAPSVGSNLTFYGSNDPNGTSVTREITGTRQQIEGTDLFVGTLDAGLPSGFSFFDFATEDISGAFAGPDSFSNSIYNGSNAYVFGRSATGFSTSQDMAVGRNVLDRFSINQVAANSTGDAIGATDDGQDGVPFEAMLASGDSGAPLFVENGAGSLTIVGINWFIADTTSDGVANAFGSTYLGNYDEQIQTFIDANPVPEPSHAALLAGLLVMLFGVSRRHV